MEPAEPVHRWDNGGVALVEDVESLPQLLALGVLAGLLVGEDPDTPCFVTPATTRSFHCRPSPAHSVEIRRLGLAHHPG